MTRQSYQPTGEPWEIAQEDDVGLSPGGKVLRLTAAAALNIGDFVFLSAAKTVNKSIVIADHRKRIGVVVGGARTDGRVMQDTTNVGMQAAAINEEVLVCVSGVAYIVVAAAIAAGVHIKPDTVTAGRVQAAGSGFAIAAGAVAVTSTAANGDIITGDGETIIAGMTLEAAAAAGDKVLALISGH